MCAPHTPYAGASPLRGTRQRQRKENFALSVLRDNDRRATDASEQAAAGQRRPRCGTGQLVRAT